MANKFCTHCGKAIEPFIAQCPHCGKPLPNHSDDAALRLLLPVGRSGLAIAAGYLGLFSILIFPAPLALGCGIAALIDLRRHKEKHGLGRALFGLLMGGLFSALLLVLIFK